MSTPSRVRRRRKAQSPTVPSSLVYTERPGVVSSSAIEPFVLALDRDRDGRFTLDDLRHCAARRSLPVDDATMVAMCRDALRRTVALGHADAPFITADDIQRAVSFRRCRVGPGSEHAYAVRPHRDDWIRLMRHLAGKKQNMFDVPSPVNVPEEVLDVGTVNAAFLMGMGAGGHAHIHSQSHSQSHSQTQSHSQSHSHSQHGGVHPQHGSVAGGGSPIGEMGGSIVYSPPRTPLPANACSRGCYSPPRTAPARLGLGGHGGAGTPHAFSGVFSSTMGGGAGGLGGSGSGTGMGGSSGGGSAVRMRDAETWKSAFTQRYPADKSFQRLRVAENTINKAAGWKGRPTGTVTGASRGVDLSGAHRLANRDKAGALGGRVGAGAVEEAGEETGGVGAAGAGMGTVVSPLSSSLSSSWGGPGRRFQRGGPQLVELPPSPSVRKGRWGDEGGSDRYVGTATSPLSGGGGSSRGGNRGGSGGVRAGVGAGAGSWAGAEVEAGVGVGARCGGDVMEEPPVRFGFGASGEFGSTLREARLASQEVERTSPWNGLPSRSPVAARASSPVRLGTTKFHHGFAGRGTALGFSTVDVELSKVERAVLGRLPFSHHSQPGRPFSTSPQLPREMVVSPSSSSNGGGGPQGQLEASDALAPPRAGSPTLSTLGGSTLGGSARGGSVTTPSPPPRGGSPGWPSGGQSQSQLSQLSQLSQHSHSHSLQDQEQLSQQQQQQQPPQPLPKFVDTPIVPADIMAVKLETSPWQASSVRGDVWENWSPSFSRPDAHARTLHGRSVYRGRDDFNGTRRTGLAGMQQESPLDDEEEGVFRCTTSKVPKLTSLVDLKPLGQLRRDRATRDDAAPNTDKLGWHWGATMGGQYVMKGPKGGWVASTGATAFTSGTGLGQRQAGGGVGQGSRQGTLDMSMSMSGTLWPKPKNIAVLTS